MKYIIKDKKRRIIIFNHIKKVNENIDGKNRKIININLKSYLKILKMISKKEKDDKYILIKIYKQYIMILKNYFTNWKNQKNIKIISNGENKAKINIKNKNNNINKEEFIILIKKLIERIIIIKNIYIYLIINNNKENEFYRQIRIKNEENIEKIKKEIEDIKNKLIELLLQLNFENEEEIKEYLKLILIEIEKVNSISEEDIGKYKELNQIKKKTNANNKIFKIRNINDIKIKKNLSLIILPLFYIIYFLYSNGKN